MAKEKPNGDPGPETVGGRVRAAREARGWSQDGLAQEAGVSQTTIDKIERGETRQSRYLSNVAKALGVALSELDPSKSDARPNRIAELREVAGMTQGELGEAVGAHWITISKLERGAIKLTQDWMNRLALPLGVTPSELLPDDGESPASEAPPERAKPVIRDPNNAPVQYVDSVLSLNVAGPGLANLVLGTWHVEPGPNSETAPPHIRVAARLRLTLPFARQLRDSLDRLLLATTPPEGGEQ